METTDDGENDEFPPEKRLEAPNTRLIKAGIEAIPDMGTLQSIRSVVFSPRAPVPSCP